MKFFKQLKNSQVPKYIWSVVSEVGQGLKDSVSSQEFKNLIDAVLATIDKVNVERTVLLE